MKINTAGTNGQPVGVLKGR